MKIFRNQFLQISCSLPHCACAFYMRNRFLLCGKQSIVSGADFPVIKVDAGKSAAMNGMDLVWVRFHFRYLDHTQG